MKTRGECVRISFTIQDLRAWRWKAEDQSMKALEYPLKTNFIYSTVFIRMKGIGGSLKRQETESSRYFADAPARIEIFLISVWFLTTQGSMILQHVRCVIWNHDPTGTLRHRDVLPTTQPELQSCHCRPSHLYSHHAQQADVRPRSIYAL